MSLVLDALNKADSENKQGVLSSANNSKINELKKNNTRKLIFIGLGNSFIIAILVHNVAGIRLSPFDLVDSMGRCFLL